MSLDPATLRIRYPTFANAPSDATIAYWITDATRLVDTSYGADHEPATLALAAHNMVVNGALPKTGVDALPAGVTAFRSGSMNVSITEAAADQAVTGGYASTAYGREFAVMLRRAKGGPRLIGGGGCAGYGIGIGYEGLPGYGR